jgi:hypothetical protein
MMCEERHMSPALANQLERDQLVPGRRVLEKIAAVPGNDEK